MSLLVSEHGIIESCCFNSVSVLFFVCLIAKYYIYCYLEEHFLLIQIAGYSTPITYLKSQQER